MGRGCREMRLKKAGILTTSTEESAELFLKEKALRKALTS